MNPSGKHAFPVLRMHCNVLSRLLSRLWACGSRLRSAFCFLAVCVIEKLQDNKVLLDRLIRSVLSAALQLESQLGNASPVQAYTNVS